MSALGVYLKTKTFGWMLVWAGRLIAPGLLSKTKKTVRQVNLTQKSLNYFQNWSQDHKNSSFLCSNWCPVSTGRLNGQTVSLIGHLRYVHKIWGTFLVKFEQIFSHWHRVSSVKLKLWNGDTWPVIVLHGRYMTLP